MATTAKKAAPKAAKATRTFSAQERAAMEEAAREAKRGKLSAADSEAEVLAKIAQMTDTDRKMAERIHEIVKAAAPGIVPKTWYGMPAYALDGKTICFFQPGAKFKTRYSTLGFQDSAKLDEGNFWPNAYAVTRIGPAEEKQIAALVKRAVG